MRTNKLGHVPLDDCVAHHKAPQSEKTYNTGVCAATGAYMGYALKAKARALCVDYVQPTTAERTFTLYKFTVYIQFILLFNYVP
jgi:hypothetical protein